MHFEEPNESAWSRGWRDTKSGLGDWRFWVLEFFGGGFIATKWSAVIALVAVAAMFACLWLWATVTAPIKQRNEARDSLCSLQKELQETIPRSLNEEQKATLADAMRQYGWHPTFLNVLYDNLDSECADFAADLGDAISMAGIDTSIHDGIMYKKDVRDRGIKIIRGKSETAIKFADIIYNTLLEMGFYPERRDGETPNSVFLFVARRAQ